MTSVRSYQQANFSVVHAQIPSCIFVDVWPIDFISGILVEE